MAEKAAPSKRERLVLLLENYVDVEAGMREKRGDGEHLPLMCRAWNHPSYIELDRLLNELRTQRRHLYWHVSQRYLYSPQRRVLQCPRCHGVMPSWSSINFHKHGQKNVAVVPRVVRVPHPDVHEQLVVAAVAWLEAAWSLDDVFVPDELLPLVS